MKNHTHTNDVEYIEPMNTLRELGNIISGGYYDYQEIRIGIKNRIRVLIRTRLEEIDLSTPETKKEDDDKDYTKKYDDKHIGELLDKLEHDKKLTTDETKYMRALLDLLKDAERLENQYKGFMEEYIMTEPIYTKFLKNIKGISAVLSSNLLKSFGYCEKYHHVSAVWKVCGMHVVDGHAPKKERGVKLDYNPKLRTLAWKISDSFVKQRTPIYRDIYDKEKLRQMNLMENTPDADNAPKSKLHADLRSRRKAVKIFLQHYYVVARKMKGLEVTDPYPIDKMGHNKSHYIAPPRFDD